MLKEEIVKFTVPRIETDIQKVGSLYIYFLQLFHSSITSYTFVIVIFIISAVGQRESERERET